MQTKLSRYCDGVMEAAWLAAALVIPVFFNLYSSRIFEPDKLALLRTLALLALAAWVVKLIDQGGPRWESLRPEGAPLRALLKVPLLLPVAGMALVYLLSTLFSVTPSTSFWGSYQRMQGAYTTFSYLVLFAALAANLRRRPQVERLLTAIILAGLPVSLYGILQRMDIDPVPWGGNVMNRIAANMGNSIFVAAFLILSFLPTLARLVQACASLVKGGGRLGPDLARAIAYGFIAVVQLVAIYFSGSRGPWLGLGAGLVILALIFAWIWRKRSLTLAGIGLAAVAVAFLLVLNIPNGPLQPLREVPGFGRLGQIFDTESRTGRVRTLIWEGASQLFLPHEPLQYPDGRRDPFNVLRPLIGYGPEAMYVAYSRFYPPELTQVEMRNASPDRSHNETWDSLVMTGVLGLGVYLLLFGSLFYYGFKWLGLLQDRRQRNLFIALYVGGGVVSSAAAVAWKGLGYFGVGLPLGMIAGVVVYLVIATLSGRGPAAQTPGEQARALTLAVLLALLAAHIVEINFGIAIAATRTYFWISAALLLLVGEILPRCGEYLSAAAEASTGEASAKQMESGAYHAPAARESARGSAARGKGRPAKGSARPATRPGVRAAGSGDLLLRASLAGGLLLGLLMITLGYNHLSISQGGETTLGVIWSSLTRLDGGATLSLGLLLLVLASWLLGAVLIASEAAREEPRLDWARLLGGILGVSFVAALLFFFVHAAGLLAATVLSAQTIEAVLDLVRRYEGHLTRYYSFLVPGLLGLGFFLPPAQSGKAGESRPYSLLAAPVLLALALALSGVTNLRRIQADIAFKLAEPFARGTSWPVSVAIYQRALQLAPSEDYYYLFLGRAYFEQAKTIGEAEQRETVIEQAERDLMKAREINPLNTDHTANLARLYSLWAAYAPDETQRLEKADLSSRYFEQAVLLSPNHAKLWDEWALLYLNYYNQPEKALELIDHAEALDPYYDYTMLLKAEYYARQMQQALPDPEKAAEAHRQALAYYDKAYDLSADAASKANSRLALSQLHIDAGKYEEAIAALEEAIQLVPTSPAVWQHEQTLAQLYLETGNREQAVEHARRSLAAAPEAQQEEIQALIDQIENVP